MWYYKDLYFITDEEVLSKAKDVKDLDEEYQAFLKALGVKGRKPNIKSAEQGGVDDKKQLKCILYRYVYQIALNNVV